MSIVKSLSVGNGDMFYIKHGSDNFTIIDCYLSEDDGERIVEELKAESKGKNITRFINFYCVKNGATKEDRTDDFDLYGELRDDAKKAFYLYRGCTRKWMNEDTEGRKNSGLDCLWPILGNGDYMEALEAAKNGDSPNNISPIIKYSLDGGATVLWMGDLDAEFMDNIQDEITIDASEILFAPHHGRDSGTVPTKWLDEMQPRLIIIGEAPSEYLNYYEGYDTITQNSAGDITLECDAGKTHIYVSNEDYSVEFLIDENMPDTYGKYIGTLMVRP
jgi:hypothetical protein